MAHMVDLALEKLKEAFCWFISKIKKFVQKISKETCDSFKHARKFLDNFDKGFKESLLKFKTMIDSIIEQVTSTISTLTSSFFCSARKPNLGLLENLVSSIVEKLQNLSAYIKKFMNLMRETAKKFGRRFSIGVCYDDEKLQGLIGLALEIVGLLISIKQKGLWGIPTIFFGACWPYVEEFVRAKIESCFKSLAEDETVKAKWVNHSVKVVYLMVLLISYL